MPERDAQLLADFLAGRDSPCPGCSYNLRDLRTVRCPECNQDLTLRVGLAEPAMWSYLSALIGLAIGAGAALLLLVGVLIISIVERDLPGGDDFNFLVIYPSIALTILAGVIHWLVRPRTRGRFLARSRPTRVALALGAWLTTAAAFGVWLVLVMRYA